MTKSEYFWASKKLAATLLVYVFSFFGASLFTVDFVNPVASKGTNPKAKGRKPEPKPDTGGQGQAFLDNLRARVLNNWFLPDGKNIVIIDATVSLNGDVLDVKTNNSSADSLAIQAAMTAFEKTQPLGHLPLKYRGNCKLTLTFTSNVDPHGDSTSDLASRIEEIYNGANNGQTSKPQSKPPYDASNSNPEGATTR